MLINKIDNCKITIDNSGINEFIKLFKKKANKKISNEDIIKLLSTSSYDQLIKLGGPNLGLESQKEWQEIFYKAVNSDVSKSIKDNLSKNKIFSTINWATSNIEDIEKANSMLIQKIKRSNFVELAREFLPNIIDKNININFVVFMPNAFGINGQVIIDILFFNKLAFEHMNQMLAHEVHHMFREDFKVDYNFNKKYNRVIQALFWLESEGIADLCNFEATRTIYESEGYVKKGKFDEILINVDQYLKKMNNEITKIFNKKNSGDNIVNFLRQDVKFHPIGFIMAKRIKEFLGIDKVRNCVGDPYKFFITYQKAAIESNGKIYKFDENIIKFLSNIYRK